MPEPTRAELKYQVERQLEEIKTVNEVGRLLSSTTDPREVIRLVASYLKGTFPIALCGVLLMEPRKLRLIQFAKIAQMDVTAAVREICTRASAGLPQPLREEALTCALEDHAAAGGPWTQGPIGYLRSNHCAPLRFNDRVIGWLSVFSGKAAAFAKEERHVIDIVADQLGAALRNTFLLDELQRANQLKNELLMVISHELRIPLTSIKEGIGLIREGALGPVNAEQQDFLKTVDDNAIRLESLIEKVLTATHLLTNQLQYTFRDVDVEAMLTALEGVFGSVAQAKGVSLQRARATRSLQCPGDAKRLTQAMAQLLENAIHATPSGGRVTIACAATAGAVEIQIHDTGAGIPAEELPRIFEQFRVVGGVDERKTGGLGLGLFIANQIITAHNGTIRLDSQAGQGTRATIRLPTAGP